MDDAVRGLRSTETAALRVKHLRSCFGTDRAVDITPIRLRAYQAARLEEQAEAGTINRELAALHRMFRLAVASGVVSSAPAFPARLEENAPRQGFFEHAEYLAIREHLPPDYRDVLDFGYHSGWRRKEITRLTWAEVDLGGVVIRLDPERSKTKTGRPSPCPRPSGACSLVAWRPGAWTPCSSSITTGSGSATGGKPGGEPARQLGCPGSCSTIFAGR